MYRYLEHHLLLLGEAVLFWNLHEWALCYFKLYLMLYEMKPFIMTYKSFVNVANRPYLCTCFQMVLTDAMSKLVSDCFEWSGCSYLAVQFFVELADALCQLGQLLSDDGLMDSLCCVRLHVKIFVQEIRIALCKQSRRSLQSPTSIQQTSDRTRVVCQKTE